METPVHGPETFAFQAEVHQLLNLMVHSLYSNKEIFLRELISNASDAIDKLNFESLTTPGLLKGETNYQIRLTPDSAHGRLSIADNGIGMTREEVLENIGTIARSGTKKWAEMAKTIEAKPELIGQFGVGFYSVFMVAEKVILHTQKAGTSDGVLWTSEGSGQFTVQSVPRAEGHGTSITLYLKKEFAGLAETASTETEDEAISAEKNFTDEWTLKSLVKNYSDFIRYPIVLQKKEGEEEVLNSQKALWTRPASEIKPEEYAELYKQVAHDWKAPLKTVHFRAEGTLDFTALVFIPEDVPFNFHSRERSHGLQLYVKRVFVMDDCKELLPEYLRFVKGLVDSPDLNLNVSREILQQTGQLGQMKRAVVSKVLNALKEMKEKSPDDYAKFWKAFGGTLKEGVLMDTGNQAKILDLLIFDTTGESANTSLNDYVTRMKPDQKAIYYITGDQLSSLKSSPHLETARKKGYEVLLMTETIDEWMMTHVPAYKEKAFVSLLKEDADLFSEDEKKERAVQKTVFEEKFKPLMTVIETHMKDTLKSVRLSDRLSESPACVVASKEDPSARMEKLISQASGRSDATSIKRILELNPEHAIVERMLLLPENQQQEWAELLYGQALLAEGTPLPNPARFTQLMTKVMLH